MSFICYSGIMDVKQRTVNFFKDKSGKEPVKEWLNKLKDKRGQQKIDVRIRRAGLGNFGDHRSVGDSVIELRIHYGPGYRVYLTITGNDELILLLVGGDKSTQDSDIERAHLLAKIVKEEDKP
jgi:putative addiction module killer protein